VRCTGKVAGLEWHDVHDHRLGAGDGERHPHEPGWERGSRSELQYRRDWNQWVFPHPEEQPGPLHRDVGRTNGSAGLVPEPDVDSDRHRRKFTSDATITLFEDSTVSDTITVPIRRAQSNKTE
jgi:hypothetical protein